jgi:RNA polymerase sigma-70 factor (ECF subfamily)
VSDLELVRRFLDGDEGAFGVIFKRHRRLVFGVLSPLLGRDPELEDVLQLTFVEVFRSLDRFEGRSKLSSWIARVALHVGFHHLRRRKSRPGEYQGDRALLDFADPAPGSDPFRSAERKELSQRVYGILTNMAPKKRAVFILNDLEGMPQEEIADAVGASVATVRTRLFYARREFWQKAHMDPVLKEYAVSARSVLREASGDEGES